MVTNQKQVKLEGNYTQKVNDFISEMRKSSEGWQTIKHPPKINESIEDLVRLNKELTEKANSMNLPQNILNMKMATKDHVVYSFGNGKIDLAGAIRISNDQILWPRVEIEKEDKFSIEESRSKVEEFLVGKGIDIRKDIETINSGNKIELEIPKPNKLEEPKIETNLYEHKQN